MQEALVDAGAVKIGQAQDSRLNLPLVMRGEQQILLRLAHAAFEGVRLAGMVLANWPRSRPAIRIDGADQHDAIHSGGDRAVERLLHQARMQLELPVVHADEVDNRVDAGAAACTEAGSSGFQVTISARESAPKAAASASRDRPTTRYGAPCALTAFAMLWPIAPAAPKSAILFMNVGPME